MLKRNDIHLDELIVLVFFESLIKEKLFNFHNLTFNVRACVCVLFFCTCFQVDDLLLIEEKIDLEVRSLETCMFDHKTFSDILNRIQKAVDDLNLYSYSNLPIWVNKLDIEVGTTTITKNTTNL